MAKSFIYALIGIIIVICAYFILKNMTHMTDPVPLNQQSAEASLLKPDQQNTTLKPLVNHSRMQSWKEFSSPSGDFKVRLPSSPQHIIDEIFDKNANESHKYQTFISTGDGGYVFMISVITYPRGLEDDQLEKTLKDSVKEMIVRNKANVLKEMNLSQFQNRKSLDFSLLNGEMLVSGKVFAKGNNLYMLSMINRANEFNAEELAYFLNSFATLK